MLLSSCLTLYTRSKPTEVHVDDLKVYDFRGEEEPSSWLKKETGLTEQLRALAVKAGSSSISGVSVTPGDRPSDMNQEEAKVVNVRIAPRARANSKQWYEKPLHQAWTNLKLW